MKWIKGVVPATRTFTIHTNHTEDEKPLFAKVLNIIYGSHTPHDIMNTMKVVVSHHSASSLCPTPPPIGRYETEEETGFHFQLGEEAEIRVEEGCVNK